MRYRYERSKRTAALFLVSLFAITLLASAASAQNTQAYAPFPAPAAGNVTDLASVFTSDSLAAINASLDSHRRSTGVEIRVLTINAMADYPGTPNGSIEAFATGLFNRWRIGNLPQNDGLLLLVSVKDRKARIEVGKGYGRARDAAAQRIMSNTIVPRLRVNDFPAGVREGVNALIREFDGRQAAQSAAPPRPPIANSYSQNPNPRPATPMAYMPQRKPFLNDEMIGLLFIAMVGIIAAGIIVRAAYREIASGGDSQRRNWDNNTSAFMLGSMFSNDSSNSSAHDSGSSFSSFDSGGSSSSSSSSDSGGGSSDGGGASGSF